MGTQVPAVVSRLRCRLPSSGPAATPKELSSSGSPGLQCISLSVIFKCPQGTEFLKSGSSTLHLHSFHSPRAAWLARSQRSERWAVAGPGVNAGCSSPALESHASLAAPCARPASTQAPASEESSLSCCYKWRAALTLSNCSNSKGRIPSSWGILGVLYTSEARNTGEIIHCYFLWQ